MNSIELKPLIPAATAWLSAVSERGRKQGRALSVAEFRIAQWVGVAHPDEIRLMITGDFPYPEEQPLQLAARSLGMLGSDTAGLALGYAVWIKPEALSDRVLSHELRHVAQFERTGSFEAFISQYLNQIFEHGYWDAPFEVDARANECHGITVTPP